MRNRTGLNILFVVLAVGTGLYLSRKPWEVYQQQQRKANEANQEMRKAETSREEYERRAAELDSPLGRETLAREKGWRRPGETSLDKE